MASYGAVPDRDDDADDYDEDKDALLPSSKFSDPPSPHRTKRGPSKYRDRERLICGLRPLHALLALAAALTSLTILFHLFPDLIHHPRRPKTDYVPLPRPTDGLRVGDSAYNAATGPWADVGDDWDLGQPVKPATAPHAALSNGTHPWKRTVILVSLDGVRADYLTRGLTPNLLDISDKGIRADFMRPIFPSLTFPNHWAILTGLYAESHGIIGNDFYDPTTDKDFLYVDPGKSWPSHWWGGEPIWATAERAGVHSAVLMWPGPPMLADGTRPHRWYAFEDHVDWSLKTDRIESWLDLPLEDRPQFIAAYLPEVDQEGHRTGAASDELNAKLRYADDFAKSIHDALAARHLHDIVDIFYVSDHGMTETSDDRLVYLEEILGEEAFAAIEHRDGWPSCGLRFKAGTDLTALLARLEKAAQASNGAFDVYTAETMPTEWHFSAEVNDRIAAVYLVPRPGWSITDRAEMVALGGTYGPRGNHGYDPAHPDMHAIFVAHGPFARAAQARHPSTMSGFPNVELYNLFAKLLDLEPAANNGTKGFWDAYL